MPNYLPSNITDEALADLSALLTKHMRNKVTIESAIFHTNAIEVTSFKQALIEKAKGQPCQLTIYFYA